MSYYIDYRGGFVTVPPSPSKGKEIVSPTFSPMPSPGTPSTPMVIPDEEVQQPRESHSVPGVMANLPFWSACPLPFDPTQYPYVIVPQPALTKRSVVPNRTHTARTTRQRSVSAKPVVGRTVTTRPVVETDRLKKKRAKRKWSNPPPRTATPATVPTERIRDERGRFMSKDEAMRRQVAELKAKLTEQTVRSQMLEKRLAESEQYRHSRPPHVDDMFSRHVLNSQLGPRSSAVPVPTQTTYAPKPVPPHLGIYSPFRSGNALVGAFTEEIDFRNKPSELRPTNGTFLEHERRYEDDRRRELEMQGAKARYQTGPMAELPSSEIVRRRENKERYLNGPMVELGGSEVFQRREQKNLYSTGPMVELAQHHPPAPYTIKDEEPMDDIPLPDLELSGSFEHVLAELGTSPPSFGTSPPGEHSFFASVGMDDSEMMEAFS